MSKIATAAELASLLAVEAHERPEGEAPAPHLIAADAIALLRTGASVKRWAVRACNGEGHREPPPGCGPLHWVWDETDAAAKDKADARALKRATEIAERYGATVEIGGDPRGYVLRLKLASGRSNTFGNDGWGIA